MMTCYMIMGSLYIGPCTRSIVTMTMTIDYDNDMAMTMTIDHDSANDNDGNRYIMIVMDN